METFESMLISEDSMLYRNFTCIDNRAKRRILYDTIDKTLTSSAHT